MPTVWLLTQRVESDDAAFAKGVFSTADLARRAAADDVGAPDLMWRAVGGGDGDGEAASFEAETVWRYGSEEIALRFTVTTFALDRLEMGDVELGGDASRGG